MLFFVDSLVAAEVPFRGCYYTYSGQCSFVRVMEVEDFDFSS